MHLQELNGGVLFMLTFRLAAQETRHWSIWQQCAFASRLLLAADEAELGYCWRVIDELILGEPTLS